MRTSLTISAIAHAALVAWGVITFTARPHKADSTEALPIDVISTEDFTKLTAGTKTAPPVEAPKPVAEKVGERKPPDDPKAKLAKTEIKAATDKPPPMPEPKPEQKPDPKPEPRPKPPAAVEKKQPPAEPKRDLIAEAIKKDAAKKPEPKKPEPKKTAAKPKPEPKRAEPKKPEPKRIEQKQTPTFDATSIEALLNKQTPQRLAATGDAISSIASAGVPRGISARLVQSEFDALKARLIQLWNPPPGNPEDARVTIVIQLRPDRTLAGGPRLITSNRNPAFVASVMRAVFQGQPFEMLRPEHYEEWKEIEIEFDLNEKLRG